MLETTLYAYDEKSGTSNLPTVCKEYVNAEKNATEI